MRHLASVFKSLSDETRLTFLAMLFQRDEMCVCEFERALHITQSKASRHLRYMAHAGLISERRDGARMLYRLVPEQHPPVSELLEVLRRHLRDVPVPKAGEVPNCSVTAEQPGPTSRPWE